MIVGVCPPNAIFDVEACHFRVWCDDVLLMNVCETEMSSAASKGLEVALSKLHAGSFEASTRQKTNRSTNKKSRVQTWVGQTIFRDTDVNLSLPLEPKAGTLSNR